MIKRVDENSIKRAKTSAAERAAKRELESLGDLAAAARNIQVAAKEFTKLAPGELAAVARKMAAMNSIGVDANRPRMVGVVNVEATTEELTPEQQEKISATLKDFSAYLAKGGYVADRPEGNSWELTPEQRAAVEEKVTKYRDIMKPGSYVIDEATLLKHSVDPAEMRRRIELRAKLKEEDMRKEAGRIVCNNATKMGSADAEERKVEPAKGLACGGYYDYSGLEQRVMDANPDTFWGSPFAGRWVVCGDGQAEFSSIVAAPSVLDQMMADGYGTRRALPAPAGLLVEHPMPNAWGRTA